MGFWSKSYLWVLFLNLQDMEYEFSLIEARAKKMPILQKTHFFASYKFMKVFSHPLTC